MDGGFALDLQLQQTQQFKGTCHIAPCHGLEHGLPAGNASIARQYLLVHVQREAKGFDVLIVNALTFQVRFQPRVNRSSNALFCKQSPSSFLCPVVAGVIIGTSWPHIHRDDHALTFKPLCFTQDHSTQEGLRFFKGHLTLFHGFHHVVTLGCHTPGDHNRASPVCRPQRDLQVDDSCGKTASLATPVPDISPLKHMGLRKHRSVVPFKGSAPGYHRSGDTVW